jgi:hypothetical protein
MYSKQLNRQLGGAQRAPAAAPGVAARPALASAHEAQRGARSAAPARQARAAFAPSRRHARSRRLACQVANVATEPARAEAIEGFSRGKHWSVHKFGGTCMANADRIKAVSQLMLADASQKVVVVSAMGSHPTSPIKVTDLILNMIKKAANQDAGFLVDLAALQGKHEDAAKLLLGDSPELAAFTARLLDDIANLKAMLQAICIGARPAGAGGAAGAAFRCWLQALVWGMGAWRLAGWARLEAAGDDARSAPASVVIVIAIIGCRSHQPASQPASQPAPWVPPPHPAPPPSSHGGHGSPVPSHPHPTDPITTPLPPQLAPQLPLLFSPPTHPHPPTHCAQPACPPTPLPTLWWATASCGLRSLWRRASSSWAATCASWTRATCWW